MRTRRTLVVVVLILALILASYGLVALIATHSRSLPSLTPDPNTSLPAIPPVVRMAYVQAAERAQAGAPQCTGLSWTLLAGIGAEESRHARGHEISATGDVTPAVLGPVLDGSGSGGNVTPVYDTDDGVLDGDPNYDRAIGPMQFLPETWTSWAQDGNADGRTDPQNVFDATLTTAAFLCGNGRVDLADPAQRDAAVFRYNASESYLADVVDYAATYAELSQPSTAAAGTTTTGTGA